MSGYPLRRSYTHFVTSGGAPRSRSDRLVLETVRLPNILPLFAISDHFPWTKATTTVVHLKRFETLLPTFVAYEMGAREGLSDPGRPCGVGGSRLSVR